MFDLRVPLVYGTIIGEYRVLDCIGMGGSALCYKAIRLSGERAVVFKETYPYQLALEGKIHRDPVTQRLVSSVDLTPYYESQKREQAIATTIRSPLKENSPYLFVVTQIIHDELPYLVVDTEGGEMLSSLMEHRLPTGILPKLPTLNSVLEFTKRMIEGIAPIHQQGYIHGDIAPDNLFVSDLQLNQQLAFSVVKPIDFNSAFLLRGLQEEGTTTSKYGYSPPEFVQREKRGQIGYGSDLYSIMAILFNLLFCQHFNLLQHVKKYRDPKTKEGFWTLDKSLFSPYCKDLQEGEKEMLFAFLYRGLKERQTDCHGCIAEIDALLNRLNPTHHLVGNFHPKPVFFYGRKKELEEIHQQLRQYHFVAIHGDVGGVGKSEIAYAYATLHQQDYDTILVATYEQDLHTLIVNDTLFNIPTLSYTNRYTKEEYYKEKLKILQQVVSKRTLIIIDNMNVSSDPHLDDLLSLNAHILFTTRNRFHRESIGVVEVPLFPHMADLETIFAHHYYKGIGEGEKAIYLEEDGPLIHQLIEAVGRLTIAVVILALAARNEPELEGLLHRIANARKQYPSEDALQFKGYYGSAEEILTALFDVVTLGAEEKELLGYLSLISYSGMEKHQLKKATASNNFNVLNRLMDKGWVLCKPQGRKEIISLHQVVSDLAFKTLSPTVESCKPLLQYLTAEATEMTGYSHIFDRFAFIAQLYGDSEETAHPLYNQYQFAVAKMLTHFSDLPTAEKQFKAIADRKGELYREALVSYAGVGVSRENLREFPSLLAIIDRLDLDPYYRLYAIQAKGWYILNTKYPNYIEDTISLFETTLDQYVDSPSIQIRLDFLRYSLAIAYYRKGVQDGDRTYFHKAIGLCTPLTNPPLSFMARNLLGEAFFRLGEEETAYNIHTALLAEKLAYYPLHTRTMAITYRNYIKMQFLRGEEGIEENLEILKEISTHCGTHEFVVFAEDIRLQILWEKEKIEGKMEETFTLLQELLQYVVTHRLGMGINHLLTHSAILLEDYKDHPLAPICRSLYQTCTTLKPVDPQP